MKIIDLNTAYSLLKEYGIRENILRHSELVMKVVQLICANLKDGIPVNAQRAAMSGLLHDIAKARSIETGERHDISGGQIMRELGFPEIAEAIETHVVLHGFDVNTVLTENEIVHYADKRVCHDKLVSIEERVADLLVRYGKIPEHRDSIIRNTSILQALERKIRANVVGDLDKILEPLE